MSCCFGASATIALSSPSPAKTGERSSIDVPDGERALSVFHHPFAYAAWHQIDTRSEGSCREVAGGTLL
jgi:hypothetical protein